MNVVQISMKKIEKMVHDGAQKDPYYCTSYNHLWINYHFGTKFVVLLLIVLTSFATWPPFCCYQNFLPSQECQRQSVWFGTWRRIHVIVLIICQIRHKDLQNSELRINCWNDRFVSIELGPNPLTLTNKIIPQNY